MKYLFIALLFVSSLSQAGFVLDCGHPVDLYGVQTNDSYKVEFSGNTVNLLVTKEDGSEAKSQLTPFYMTKDITQFFSQDHDYLNLSILQNSSGYHINISGFGRPSQWHSDCK